MGACVFLLVVSKETLSPSRAVVWRCHPKHSSYLQKLILWAVKAPQSPESPSCWHWVSIIYFFVGICSPAWEKKGAWWEEWSKSQCARLGFKICELLNNLCSQQGSKSIFPLPEQRFSNPVLTSRARICKDCFRPQGLVPRKTNGEQPQHSEIGVRQDRKINPEPSQNFTFWRNALQILPST